MPTRAATAPAGSATTALPKPGQRIRLTHMGEDPCPIPTGTEGTVTTVTVWGRDAADRPCGQIAVAWDIPRSLMLALPEDRFEIVEG